MILVRPLILGWVRLAWAKLDLRRRGRAKANLVKAFNPLGLKP